VRPDVDRMVCDAAAEEEDAGPDDHLAREHPSPRCVRRREPADERPDGDRDGAGGPDQAVGPRPPLGWEVRRDERHDRRHDQSRPDPLEERPPEEQHGEVRRERRRQRPRAIDHESDRERALATDDRADLAARDHQHRHHERVEDDGALDPGDGGVEIVGDRRDRDVHDGAVERHQELAGGEREQHGTGSLCDLLIRRVERHAGHSSVTATDGSPTPDRPSSASNLMTRGSALSETFPSPRHTTNSDSCACRCDLRRRSARRPDRAMRGARPAPT